MGKNWTYINPKNECVEVLAGNMWNVAYHDMMYSSGMMIVYVNKDNARCYLLEKVGSTKIDVFDPNFSLVNSVFSYISDRR